MEPHGMSDYLLHGISEDSFLVGVSLQPRAITQVSCHHPSALTIAIPEQPEKQRSRHLQHGKRQQGHKGTKLQQGGRRPTAQKGAEHAHSLRTDTSPGTVHNANRLCLREMTV